MTTTAGGLLLALRSRQGGPWRLRWFKALGVYYTAGWRVQYITYRHNERSNACTVNAFHTYSSPLRHFPRRKRA